MKGPPVRVGDTSDPPSGAVLGGKGANAQDLPTKAANSASLIPPGVFATVGFDALRAPHRSVFTAMRVHSGSSDSDHRLPRKGETSCAVPPPAAPAARPATPDAVNTSNRCFPVCRSNNAAAAHPTPAPPAADRCFHGCSDADRACTPAGVKQRLAGAATTTVESQLCPTSGVPRVFLSALSRLPVPGVIPDR